MINPFNKILFIFECKNDVTIVICCKRSERMNSVPLSQLTPRSYQREVANLEHVISLLNEYLVRNSHSSLQSVEIVKSQIQRLIDTFKQYSNTGLCT